jgi:hypothetical protein
MARHKLILLLAQKFLHDFEESLKGFSNEEQIHITDILIESALRFEKNEEYESVYNSTIELLIRKYRSKIKTLNNKRLSDYFLQESLMFFDLQYDLKIDDDNQHMTDEEYTSFMKQVKNILSNHRYHTLLSMPPVSEPVLGDPLTGPKNKNNEITEHSARRRALFLHYLDKHFTLNSKGNKQALIDIAHFLIGSNKHNLAKYLRSPLKSSEGENGTISQESLREDLVFVKALFKRIGLEKATIAIDKDLKSS